MLALEAEYLALGLLNLIYALSPMRVIVGGGVMKEPGLRALIQERVRRLAAGYPDCPAVQNDVDGYVVAPTLGGRAGVLGAL